MHKVIYKSKVKTHTKPKSEVHKLHYCSGCTNNLYNGNNPYGIERCWALDSAEVVQRKFIHLNDVPPWDRQPVETTYSCHVRRGYVKVREEVTC